MSTGNNVKSRRLCVMSSFFSTAFSFRLFNIAYNKTTFKVFLNSTFTCILEHLTRKIHIVIHHFTSGHIQAHLDEVVLIFPFIRVICNYIVTLNVTYLMINQSINPAPSFVIWSWASWRWSVRKMSVSVLWCSTGGGGVRLTGPPRDRLVGLVQSERRLRVETCNFIR